LVHLRQWMRGRGLAHALRRHRGPEFHSAVCTKQKVLMTKRSAEYSLV
jgi:hypothetical protein